MWTALEHGDAVVHHGHVFAGELAAQCGLLKERVITPLHLDGRMLDYQPEHCVAVAHKVAAHIAACVEDVANLGLVDAVGALHLARERVDDSRVAWGGTVGVQKLIADVLVALPYGLQPGAQWLVKIRLDAVAAVDDGVDVCLPSQVRV